MAPVEAVTLILDAVGPAAGALGLGARAAPESVPIGAPGLALLAGGVGALVGAGLAALRRRGGAAEPPVAPPASSPATTSFTPAFPEDERFRTLVEQVRDYAIFMTDPVGRATTWNAGVQRVFGYDESEWLGLRTRVTFTPEDQALGVPEQELATAAEKGAASDDRWLIRKDGSRFFAGGMTTRLVDDSGRLIGFSKVLRDRTEWKRAQDALEASETRLRVALQAARAGTWRWDPATDLLESDASLLRLLGVPAGPGIQTREEFLRHVHPDDRDRYASSLRQALEAGTELDLQFRVLLPEGTERWLSTHGQVIRDSDGRPIYLAGAAIEITERKFAEDRLSQAQRMEAVGQLAGGVAHEINNMMQVVLGFTDLLLRNLGLTDPRRGDVEQIRRAAGRAANITGQLLAFSRRQVLRPRVLTLSEVVKGLEPILRRMLGEDKLLLTDLGPGVSRVRADPGQLEQVLVNLTLNARDAMPAGGQLTIRLRVVDPPEPLDHPHDPAYTGRAVLLSVSDTGRGMDSGTRARAFEPFFTTKPPGQGTGLGLATVFGIVRQSGGTVRLQSEVGAGTTIDLYLPEVVEEVEPSARPPVAGAPSGRRAVLVVEDEEMVRSFACRYLRELGFDCLEAAHGAEALELIQGHADEIALVLTDVVMPVMGGRELAQEVAALRPDLPVLFMSGYPNDEVVRRGLLEPGAAYLQKPFTPDDLAAKVRALFPH